MRYVTILVSLAVSVAVAQTPDRSTTPGFWKDWAWDAGPTTVAASGATPADMKTLVTKLLELREVLKSAPAVAHPVGFNAYLQGHFIGFKGPASDPKARTSPIAAELWFGAFPQEFDPAGNLTQRIGETQLLPIMLNVTPLGSKPPEWEKVDTDAFLQPAPLGDVAGLPRFGDVLVLKKNPKDLWSPVSVEASLQLMAAQRKQSIADHEKAAASIRKSLADWIDPAKKAARMAARQAQAAKQKDPDKYLADQEASDRKTEEALRKQVDQDASPVNNRYWAADLAQVAAVDQALAALSADQKAAPACYVETAGRNTDERPLSKIVPAGTSGCRAIVRANPDYFDRKLPRTAFQLLTVGMVSRCLDDPAQLKSTRRSGCPANVAFIRSVDWPKVASLLDK
jgi:hypothetical protein